MTEDWVIVELNPRGEGEDPDLLVQSIQQVIRGADVFVPALISQVAEEKVVKYLWEGYVFVRRTHTDSTYFKLEGTRYVQKVLTQPGPGRDRRMATISSTEVDKLRSQIKVETDQGIRVSDEVKVTSGPYKGISGRVIEEILEDDSVQVFIKLRSKETIVTLPRSFLKFVAHSSEPLPTTRREDRMARWRAWLSRIRRGFSWNADSLKELEAKHAIWFQLNSLARRGFRVDSFLRAYHTNIDVKSLREKYAEWKTLSTLGRKMEKLQRATTLSRYDAKPYKALHQKMVEWEWFQSIMARLGTLQASVATLERTIVAVEHPDLVQNVIVDGHNLAFRCLYADKRGLRDSKGRATGVLFGVIQSLTALKKKHPSATFYVAWDGGRDRRVKLFPEYKAHRNPNTGLDDAQVRALKEILPYLGVHQLHEPGEETDDLIAAIVKGPLKGQQNLILSTDRDFLQLVSETDTLLCPRTQTAKDPRTEVLFNPTEVLGQYGVEPSRIVQLRALLGDESDNIPGVPRVPEKILKALLQMHGTVEGVFSSNLSGLTTKQYETLRGFEKQARLNVKLMTLKVDLPFTLKAATPDKKEVERRLGEYDIKTEGVQDAFFWRT